MTALTPGCDPDMSTTGAPYGRPARGPRVRSGLVLAALVALCALLVAGGSVPAPVSVAAAVVGGLGAMALLRRGVRSVHRARPAVGGPVGRLVPRSRPVPTGAP